MLNSLPEFRATVIICCLFFFTSESQAAILNVGGGQTYSSITAAHAAAVDGDTIILHNDIIEFDISITKSVRIEGLPGVRRVINANLSGKGPLINATGPVVLKNLIMKNGYRTTGGGAGFFAFSELLVENCSINNNRNANSAGGNGAGMYMGNNANVTFIDSEFSDNISNNGWGGGIFQESGNLTMTNCQITSNDAYFQGGGGIWANGVVNMTGCSIIGNNAGSVGSGGMYLNGSLTMINSVVSNNTTSNAGGAGGMRLIGGTSTITGSTISDNYAGTTGGGLRLESGDFTITNSTIAKNRAPRFYGGGIDVRTSSLTIIDCTFKENSTQENGGGMYVSGNNGSIVITNTIFADNIAVATVDIYTGKACAINNSLIENTPSNWFGANNIFNTDPQLGPLALNGNPSGAFTCAIPGNSAATDGGTSDGSPAADQRGFANTGTPDIGAFEFQSLPPPTMQSTDLEISNVTTSSVDLNWTIGNGIKRVVVAKAVSTVDGFPVNGSIYTGNSAFGSGSQIDSENFVLAHTTGSAVTVTNLNPDTKYHFAIFEYNDLTYPSYMNAPTISEATTSAMPVPIVLVRFDINESGCEAVLEWETLTETNNSHFVIERSQEGRTFKEVGQVMGSGSSFSLNQYKFIDPMISAQSYYRIRQVDFNGETSVSETKVIQSSCNDTAGRTGFILVYPNPVSTVDEINVNVNAPEEGTSVLEVMDTKGQIVKKFEFNLSRGYNRLPVHLVDFDNGLYFLRFVSSRWQSVSAILIISN